MCRRAPTRYCAFRVTIKLYLWPISNLLPLFIGGRLSNNIFRGSPSRLLNPVLHSMSIPTFSSSDLLLIIPLLCPRYSVSSRHRQPGIPPLPTPSPPQLPANEFCDFSDSMAFLVIPIAVPWQAILIVRSVTQAAFTLAHCLPICFIPCLRIGRKYERRQWERDLSGPLSRRPPRGKGRPAGAYPYPAQEPFASK